MWPNRTLIDRLGIDHPLIQAPMAGSNDSALAIAVSQAGALGSLPCASLTAEQVRHEFELVRKNTDAPVNANFFCHEPPVADEQAQRRWRQSLVPYYVDLGLDPSATVSGPARAPFDRQWCELMLELGPEVISFHFGLPDADLMSRLKNAGMLVLSSATTVAEARWLESRGADAVIAQGIEAGGHRGMFLRKDLSGQCELSQLLPAVVNAVRIPVIAAGGLSDAQGIAAAMAGGAAAVQIGTAYLFCPEARISGPYRAALASATADDTVITNVFTGRAARGISNRLIREMGPMREDLPAFPLAAAAVQPLRAAAEGRGCGEFSPLWAGRAVASGRRMSAAELTRAFARDALEQFKSAPGA